MSNAANKRPDTRQSLALKATNHTSLLDAALIYASMGIPVFPLAPKDKRPLPGSHGCKDGTTDAEQIHEWWERTPNANIGIATGPDAGFFVLDVDGDKGRESLQHLASNHGPLPATVASKTGRGEHLLFKDSGGHKISASAVGPNLDIRTAGGYIVAPPSIHPSGHQYEWQSDGVVADAPDWLLARMSPTIEPSKHRTLEGGAGTSLILEGGRNAALTSFAGHLRRKGIEGDALFDLVMTYNINFCDPPLHEREVRSIARSISNYPVLEKHELTDHGNAMRFVALHGDNLRYVVPGGFWLQWQETHWHEISRDAVLKLVFDVPGVILLEATICEDDVKAATALRKHAIASQSRSRLEAMLELARPLLGIEGERLDANPMMLSVANGQLDLATGTLLPHRRKDYITKLIDQEFDPRAPRPRWDQFIREVTCDEPDLASFLQRVGGYCLTGSTKEQVLFLFHGHGANGKSTVIEILMAIMGPYATKTPMTTFLSAKGEKASNDLARLRGTHLVSAVEVGRGDRLNEPLIKELTGGDRVTARFLYREYFEYRAQFKIVMSVNDLPQIEAGDAAINRRLIVVPFRATFSEGDCDQNLLEKLQMELPGILAWLVDGCSAWRREGLNRPISVKSATDSYIRTNDALGEFIKDNCIEADGHTTTTKEFYAAYWPWLKETHGGETNKVALGRLMAKKGYASKSVSGERLYNGIALKGRRF